MVCSGRLGRALWLGLVCCLAGGCSTFVAYPGPPLPDSDVATLSCYSRYYFVYIESCRFQAVDGQRPKLSELFGNASKMTPGPHWFEVAFEKYFGGGGGVTDVCAFDMEVQSGYSYQIKAHSLQTDIGLLAKHDQRGFYGGSLTIEVTSPARTQETRQVAVTCNFAGGSMCRRDSDCVPHPDIRCFPQQGFAFGACRFWDGP